MKFYQNNSLSRNSHEEPHFLFLQDYTFMFYTIAWNLGSPINLKNYILLEMYKTY